MPRIQIDDLPDELEIGLDELRKIHGGGSTFAATFKPLTLPDIAQGHDKWLPSGIQWTYQQSQGMFKY